MKKILHISHRQDMDGKVAPMLTKLINPAATVEVLLLSNKDMNTDTIIKVRSIMETMQAGNVEYDEVIITDLGLNEEAFENVLELAQFVPTSFYDHHIDSVKNAKKYPGHSYIHVDDTVSATFLYGMDIWNKAPHTKSLVFNESRYLEIVKNVSDYDTYKFKDNNNTDAERLNILLGIAGDSVFEMCLGYYLRGENTKMGLDKDLALVDFILDDRQKYINYNEKTAKIVHIIGRKCVIVFTDRFDYVSELGYQICEKHPEIDLLMALNPSNTNVQLRARKESTFLYEFSQFFGGGGHPFSAGFPFTMDFYIDLLKVWDESKEYLVTR